MFSGGGIVWALIGAIVLLLGLTIELVVSVRRINTSFAKLGFVIREDAKKYFDEASDKIVDTNQKFQETYTEIVHRGTQSALQDVSTVMKDAVIKAQQDAGSIIIEARKEAQNILSSARNESETYRHRALDESVATIEWVLEEYVGKSYSNTDHIELIHRLVDEYVNESRISQ